MSSELRVNKLTSRSGVGTVTFNDSGLIITGIATAATLDITGNATIAGVLSYDDVTNVDSVGIITARSDLSIADKIIHTGDTNTSIRFPAADTFTVETSGSEKLRINSDGKLILSGTARTTPFIVGDGGMCIEQSFDDNVRALTIRNKDTDAAAATSFAFSLNRSGGDQDYAAGEIKLIKEQDWTTTSSTVDGAMVFSTIENGSLGEKLRIDSSGNLSLGHSSVAFPSGGGLQVYNATAPRIKLTNSTTGVGSGDGSYLYVSGSDFIIENKEGADMRFYTSAIEAMRINSARQLLLGTGTEGHGSADDLTIAHGSNAGMTIRSGNTSQGSIYFSDATSGAGEYAGWLRYSHSANNMTIGTNSTEAIKIDSSQNFGIGTAPNAKLHIKLDTDKHLYFQGNIGEIGSVPGIQGVTDAGALASLGLRGNDLRFATGSSERMRITSSGNIGIGINNPSTKLDILRSGSGVAARFGKDSIFGELQVDGQRIGIQGTRSSDSAITGFFVENPASTGTSNFELVTIKTSGTERLRIDSSGRMLLGTTTEGEATADNLTISDSGHCGITLRSGTSSVGTIFFSDGTSGSAEYQGYVQYDHSGNFLKWATAGTERLRITSAGSLQITDPSSSTGLKSKISFVTESPHQDEVVYIGFDRTASAGGAPSDLTFATGTVGGVSEKMRLNNSGQLLIGTTATRSGATTYGSTAPAVLIERAVNSHSNADLTLINNSSSAYYPKLTLAVTKGSTAGSHGNIGQSEGMGYIVFAGSDGTNLIEGARIAAITDGATGTNDMPGRLAFYTTADGASSPTERLKITSGGKLRAPGVYNLTTTGGGPVYVESDGDLLRYTSSLKYKTDVETIEDARADAILNCRPVWYRSKCENDIKGEGAEKSDWGWYGFIAEEVAEVEPRLVSWATKDAVTQEDGSVETVERDPTNYEAEGVRYDNFVPLLVNLVKRQQQAIETLEAKVAALEG